jgi:SAM-dependent methyltransferase
MHLNSTLLFEKYAKKYFLDGKKVLEIGPSGFPTVYQKLVKNENLTWHTIDFVDSIYIGEAQPKLTYTLSNPYEFPVESDTYDIVLSGQVIEHVGKVWEWVRELKRVLKPNGVIITINPVSWPYHEAPIDCWRIFPEGIKSLAQEHSLTTVECICDSLETSEILKKDKKAVFIPGKSYLHEYSPAQLKYLIAWNKLIRVVPVAKRYLRIPVEVSYDTFSVLQKN